MVAVRNIILLVSFLFITANMSGEGYEITIKIRGLANQSVILGHYLSKSMYPDDTVKVDAYGKGVFQGKHHLDEGMYLVYLPNTRYFDIIIGKDQVFSLEADTVDFIRSLTIKGSEENQVFLGFQQYMSSLRVKADSLNLLLKSAIDVETQENLTAELKKVNSDRINRIESIRTNYPDFFVSVFLKATLDVYVPDPPKDEHGVVKDSTWQYYYYRNHYFDNFDFTDPRLLRTPFYEDKVMTYITKVIPQIPDSLIPQVDYFIEKSRVDSGLFRYMLITLFNHFGKSNIMGMDAVQVHIADKYYIHESWWSDAKFLAELKDRTEKAKPLLIGSIAPDAELMWVPEEHFKAALTDTSLRRYPHVGSKINLHQISSQYLVVIFWEADCGHCKTAVPELYGIYVKSLRELGIKVLAISTLFGEDGKAKWVDFVNANHLYDWINAWNPYSYDFKLKYDVVTTPQIYILDENKKIIAKKISPDQVEDIILSIIKR